MDLAGRGTLLGQRGGRFPRFLTGIAVGVAVAAAACGGGTAAPNGPTLSPVAETYSESAEAVAVQRDGKVVVAGWRSVAAEDSSDFDVMETTFFALSRYNPDGRLDASFGAGGRVLTGFGSSAVDQAGAVAIQNDGKIIAAGSSLRGGDGTGPADFALARYLPNGRLDPSFGTAGRVLTGFGPKHNDVVTGLAVQSDGKILAAGSSTIGRTAQFVLARYAVNGRLDPTFGGGGKVLTRFGANSVVASAVAIQADGRVVVAGTSTPPPPYEESPGDDFALARYLPDGRLDPSFGSGGTVSTDFTNAGLGVNDLYALAIQTDGRIVSAGYGEPTWANPGGSLVSVLARYTSEGALDPGFGEKGQLVIDQARMNGVAIDEDGSIIGAGQDEYLGAISLVRVTADGRLDTTFGVGGTARVDIGSLADDDASAVAIQADGKIIAAGSSFHRGVGHFALARITANGTLDRSYVGGTVLTRFAPAHTRVASLSAVAAKHGVLVRWNTTSERNSRGFNVYRARFVNVDSRYSRLAKANAQMFLSKGGPARRASYSFFHQRVSSGNDYYWIKEFKRDGKQVLFGPTRVRR